jgi:hypothetical protein
MSGVMSAFGGEADYLYSPIGYPTCGLPSKSAGLINGAMPQLRYLISPNSDVTINEFVFNRSAYSGSLSMRVGKGLVRFVGGQISHSGGAGIATSMATMAFAAAWP